MKIENEEQHASALKRIEELWECDPDSIEGVEIEMLVEAVVRYEAEEEDWERLPTNNII